MNSSRPSPERAKSGIGLWLGYLLAIACLIYVFYDIRPEKALHEFAGVDWKWVCLGMLFDVLSYVAQGIRWKLLLRPFGRVRLGESTRAIFAGLFANLILPLRSGELLRSYLVAQSEGIGVGRALGSVGVERLVDLGVVTAALGVVSLFIPLPGRLGRAAEILGVVILALVGLMFFAVLYLEYRLAEDPTLGHTSRGAFRKLVPILSGLRAMSRPASFYPAVAASFLTPLLQVFALWAMMNAFGLELPFLSVAIVLLVINLGVSLPNAPGNVGSYQFFCVLGLTLFGVEKTTAAGFSVFAFIALTFPIAVIGFIALLRCGLTIGGMRREVSRLLSEGLSPAAPPLAASGSREMAAQDFSKHGR